MSAYGDSESEASVKHREINEEDWGDDVSIIERYEGASPTTIIFKIVLALLFIGACSGALVYSIINSEDDQKHEFEPSEKFPIRASQECTNGSLTMTYRTGLDMGDAAGYQTVNYGCTWIQDDVKKRLYHRVGLGDKDFQYAYYVFENITFFQMKKGRCYQMPQGYNDFLDSQGLDYITLQKDEDFMIGGVYTNVLIYEGEPPLDTNINGEHPSLIRGYASTSSLLTYGWQMYFAHTTNF